MKKPWTMLSRAYDNIERMHKRNQRLLRPPRPSFFPASLVKLCKDNAALKKEIATLKKQAHFRKENSKQPKQ